MSDGRDIAVLEGREVPLKGLDGLLRLFAVDLASNARRSLGTRFSLAKAGEPRPSGSPAYPKATPAQLQPVFVPQSRHV